MNDEETKTARTYWVNTTRRGVYLLPNLLTTGTLFSGFYSILVAHEERFVEAAVAIFFAMIFDGLDGRVARLTGTQSQFGTQYDSLSDMVAFGVAPAVLVFSWMLTSLDNFGWSVAFIYTSCAALRLARFNIHADSAGSRYFQGLATPPAAALLASMVWSGADLERSIIYALVVGAVTALLGLLMVSNLVYPSFKNISFDRRVPFVFVLVAILTAGVIMSDPPRMLLLCAATYALYAPVRWMVRRVRRNDLSGFLSRMRGKRRTDQN